MGYVLLIGADDAIHTKIVAVHFAIASQITPKGPIGPSLFVFGLKTVVVPFPDKTALHVLARPHQIPVILEITHAVTHGVRVFTHDIRATQVFFGITQHVLPGRIHVTDNVGVPIALIRLFVLHRTAVIPCLDPIIEIEKGLTVAGLVAQRPDNH